MLGFELFQQEIAAAVEVDVQKYKEVTPSDEVHAEGVAMTMRNTIRDATEYSKKKLSKIVSVANPALGQEWLQEVCRNNHSLRHTLRFHVHMMCCLLKKNSDREALESICIE